MLTKSMANKINDGLEIGMHFHEMGSLNQIDRSDYESSPDGQNVLIEISPSTKDSISRWAERLTKKFKEIPTRDAQLLAYSVNVAATGLPKEIRKYVETEITEKGFNATFGYYKNLALDLNKLAPRDEVRSYKPHSSEWVVSPLAEEEEEERTPQALYESVYSRYIESYEDNYRGPYKQRNLYSDAEITAEAVVAAEYGENGKKYFEIVNKEQSLQSTISKIRRAGTHQIGDMGKKLFKWSRNPKIRNTYKFEEIEKIWDTYKAKKEELKKYRKAH